MNQPSTRSRHVLRSRIGLPGDEELSTGVRVLQQGDERSTAVESDPWNTGAGVPNPICFAELGRGAEEQSLAFELVVLVGQRTVLTDRRPVVVAGIYARQSANRRNAETTLPGIH